MCASFSLAYLQFSELLLSFPLSRAFLVSHESFSKLCWNERRERETRDCIMYALSAYIFACEVVSGLKMVLTFRLHIFRAPFNGHPFQFNFTWAILSEEFCMNNSLIIYKLLATTSAATRFSCKTSNFNANNNKFGWKIRPIFSRFR